MGSEKINQSNATIGNGGVQAGRDATVIYNHNYGDYIDVLKNLKTKMLNLQVEIEDGEKIDELISQLKGYVNPDNYEGKTLEEKLGQGDRTEMIKKALLLKEEFAKKLGEYQFSRLAQEIFVGLLALIEQRFTNLVYPKILAGEPREAVDVTWHNEIIEGLSNITEIPPLNLNAGHISGMVYYLTGTCWIDWS